jgi:hypothetical protein
MKAHENMKVTGGNDVHDDVVIKPRPTHREVRFDYCK